MVLLVLICSNVALLLFARAATRESELAVRTALGASRSRIVAQMFAEALVLGGVAAVIGLAAAHLALKNWGLPFLEVNLGRLPFWYDVSLSPATVLFALGLTVLGSAIAGVMPALKVTRRMGSRLKQATAGAGGLQFGGIWTAVIVVQVAVTVAFPAVVYVEQGQLRAHPGRSMRDSPPRSIWPCSWRWDTRSSQERTPMPTAPRSAPRSRRARGAAPARCRGARGCRGDVRGGPAAPDRPWIIEMGYDLDCPTAPAKRKRRSAQRRLDAEPPLREATVAAVEPSYFDVLETPVLAGRAFAAADSPGTHVAIVDQGFVDRCCRGEIPSGSRCDSALGHPHDAGGRGTRTIRGTG